MRAQDTVAYIPPTRTMMLNIYAVCTLAPVPCELDAPTSAAYCVFRQGQPHQGQGMAQRPQCDRTVRSDFGCVKAVRTPANPKGPLWLVLWWFKSPRVFRDPFAPLRTPITVLEVKGVALQTAEAFRSPCFLGRRRTQKLLCPAQAAYHRPSTKQEACPRAASTWCVALRESPKRRRFTCSLTSWGPQCCASLSKADATAEPAGADGRCTVSLQALWRSNGFLP